MVRLKIALKRGPRKAPPYPHTLVRHLELKLKCPYYSSTAELQTDITDFKYSNKTDVDDVNYSYKTDFTNISYGYSKSCGSTLAIARARAVDQWYQHYQHYAYALEVGGG